MAIGITLDDLLKTMQKSGIPMNTASAQPVYKTQSDRMEGARGNIPQALQSLSPSQEKYRQEYMNKINKIAEMDQKLAGVYGDPSSNLYIEHAGARENAIYGARPVTEAVAENVIGQYGQDVNQYNKKVSEATQYYDDLIKQQKEAEKQLRSSAPVQVSNIDTYLQSDNLENDISKYLQDERPDINSFIEEGRPDLLNFTL